MLRKYQKATTLAIKSNLSRFPNALFSTFDHRSIQTKWQKIWDETRPPSSKKLEDDTKEKFYCLSQFPYPSGNIHMGHARVYYITDTIAKFESLQGKTVFNPMGWDAFGLPAENAALDRNIQPSVWTKNNIQESKRDLINLGVEFDWDHEIATCDPSYYKWTQWIFTQMFKKGIAAKKPGVVNWDPVDQTVLANEQIDENGRSWRSNAIVEKKQLDQWFFAITKYAKRLSDDLDLLPDWPETVKEMQKGWIGYSEGANLHFEVFDSNKRIDANEKIEVYTTRLDTLFGCTFLALSYEHPLALKFATANEKEAIEKKQQELAKLDELTKKKLGKQKEGLLLSNIVAIHPFTKKQIPIYLTNYVLPGYGTGAVMGVPAHDERDKEFAELHNLEIVEVLTPHDEKNPQEHVLKNSGDFDGLSPKEAVRKMIEALSANGQARLATNISIRDWLISRQRYWGVPIPMINFESRGWVPESDSNLPLLLPKALENLADLKHISPLSRVKEFVETKCPTTGEKGVREFDTMDTFVDSSWYYLRYLDPNNDQELCRKDLLERWLPVDVYIGGIEHAIMHLLYARFFHKFLYDIGAVPKHQEPFKQLITQGLVKGKTYRLKSNGKYLFPHERGNYKDEEISIDFEKMSKSKGNGVPPIDIVEQYGSDCLRIAMFFYGPIEKDIAWEDSLLKTIDNFLDKLNALSIKVSHGLREGAQISEENLKDYLTSLNEPANQEKKNFVLSVLDILESLELAFKRKERHLHVAVARFMETINFFNDNKDLLDKLPVEAFLCFRLLLIFSFPLAPFLSSELWQNFAGFKSHIDTDKDQYFGNVSELLKNQKASSIQEIKSLIKSQEKDIEMEIYVNAKSNGSVRVPLALLNNDKELQQFIEEQNLKGLEKGIRKMIRPKGKNLINIVLK